MDSDEFDMDIALKPYLKYKHQADLTGSKSEEKNFFLKAINRLNLDHI